VQLHLSADHRRHILRVGSCACAAAVDVGGNVVDLLAVLVGDDGSLGRASVCAEQDTVLIFFFPPKQSAQSRIGTKRITHLENNASNGGTRLDSNGRAHAHTLQQRVPSYFEGRNRDDQFS